MHQRWSWGNKAWGQGQDKDAKIIPRLRTDFSKIDPVEAKDRNARGQGRGSRTQAPVFSKKKKKSSKKLFTRSQKKGLRKFSARFLAFSYEILSFQKIVLSSAKDRATFEDLKLRGQGLDLRGPDQRLQNVSLRMSSRPRMTSRTPPLLCVSSWGLKIKRCALLHKSKSVWNRVAIARWAFRSFVVYLNNRTLFTCNCIFQMQRWSTRERPWPRVLFFWFVKNENNQRKLNLNFGFQLDDLFFKIA